MDKKITSAEEEEDWAAGSGGALEAKAVEETAGWVAEEADCDERDLTKERNEKKRR